MEACRVCHSRSAKDKMLPSVLVAPRSAAGEHLTFSHWICFLVRNTGLNCNCKLTIITSWWWASLRLSASHFIYNMNLESWGVVRLHQRFLLPLHPGPLGSSGDIFSNPNAQITRGTNQTRICGGTAALVLSEAPQLIPLCSQDWEPRLGTSRLAVQVTIHLKNSMILHEIFYCILKNKILLMLSLLWAHNISTQGPQYSPWGEDARNGGLVGLWEDKILHGGTVPHIVLQPAANIVISDQDFNRNLSHKICG